MTAAFHPHHESAQISRPASAKPPRHPNGVLVATILASSLAFVDGSVVNVGLPAIAASFKANAGELQWIVNAYLLPLGALLLLGGAAGDRFGRVRLLVIGTTLFSLDILWLAHSHPTCIGLFLAAPLKAAAPLS